MYGYPQQDGPDNHDNFGNLNSNSVHGNLDNLNNHSVIGNKSPTTKESEGADNEGKNRF